MKIRLEHSFDRCCDKCRGLCKKDVTGGAAELLEIQKGLKALQLLRRGNECGIFDDAPHYAADVRKLLKAAKV